MRPVGTKHTAEAAARAARAAARAAEEKPQ